MLTTCVCVFILSGCGGGGGGSNDTFVTSSNSVFGETLFLESEFTSTQEILMADVDLDGDIDIISVNQGGPNRLVWCKNRTSRMILLSNKITDNLFTLCRTRYNLSISL